MKTLPWTVLLALVTCTGCRSWANPPEGETDSETSTATTDPTTMTSVGPTTDSSGSDSDSDSETEPVCGNGVREGDEQCDDGNESNSDECLNDCKMASCGDGHLYAGDEDGEGAEACDDGNEVESDACTPNCTVATCGDGFVFAGDEEGQGAEPCDDGNEENTDNCLNGCILAGCGDGYVFDGVELCDDGNNDNSDACLDTCVAASCGDGQVYIDVEECDEGDGNIKGAQCSPMCHVEREVFVTSATFYGNLEVASGSPELSDLVEGAQGGGFSSLEVADKACQFLASSDDSVVKNKMDSKYQAWLSDGTDGMDIPDRFELEIGFSGRLILVDDKGVVVDSWQEVLESGQITKEVGYDENAVARNEVFVWTGLSNMGESTGLDCSEWTSKEFSNDEGGTVGIVGSDLLIDGWSKLQGENKEATCNNAYHLYCFETSLD